MRVIKVVGRVEQIEDDLDRGAPVFTNRVQCIGVSVMPSIERACSIVTAAGSVRSFLRPRTRTTTRVGCWGMRCASRFI